EQRESGSEFEYSRDYCRACMRVGRQSVFGGTKNTSMASSAAAFIATKVRAGEEIRFKGKARGTNRSRAARATSISSSTSRKLRHRALVSASVDPRISRIAQGSTRRPNL